MAMVKDELTGIEYDSQKGPTDEQKRAMEEAKVRQQKTEYENQKVVDENGNVVSQADVDRKEGERKAQKYKEIEEMKRRMRTSTGGITGGATGWDRITSTPEGQIDYINKELEAKGYDPLTEEEKQQIKDDYTREHASVDPYTGKIRNPEQVKKEAEESVKEISGPPSTPNVLKEQTDIDVSKSLWGNQKKPVDTSAFPRSIWQAWKNGEFGTWVNEDGTIDEEAKKNAEQIRNNLMLNSVLTAIGNVSRGAYQGLNGQDIGGHKDSLWQERQAENIRKQTDRENTQRDVIMDTQTKELLTNRWNSYTPEQKQGMLDALNAYQKGELSKADDLIRNSMGKEKYAEWLEYFENLKAQLSINADARQQQQLNYMQTMGPLGFLMEAIGLFRR